MNGTTLEFIGNNAVLRSEGRVCETAEDLLRSPLSRQLLDRYLDLLCERHSMLLGIFGQEEGDFPSRIRQFWENLKMGGPNQGVIREKREVSVAQRELLIHILVLLLKLQASEVPGVLKESQKVLADPGLFMEFVDAFYEYWRRLDRFLVVANDLHRLRPRTVIKENIEKLNTLIINAYRDIRDHLVEFSVRTFRQVRAGAEMTVITQRHPAFPLSGVYAGLAAVPVIRQAIVAPPLILNPPMNKRTGGFEKISKNPAGLFEVKPEDWLCYPAK
ncbi:MAG: hypothetical protein JXB25_08000, partial [Deltaproteobacteria bacterium]|nr:hypothetical protein [Deltaproteobacteria bacterium]